MAVAEVELLDAVVYLLLPHHGRGLAVRRVEPAVHERRVVVVEPEGYVVWWLVIVSAVRKVPGFISAGADKFV